MLTIGLVVALAPAALIAAVGRHPVQLDSRVHFYAVGVTALAAAAAAVALTIVGARFKDTRTVLVGTAFAAMAALLALHGLATPGFLFGYTRRARADRRDDAARGRRDPGRVRAAASARAARRQAAARAGGPSC